MKSFNLTCPVNSLGYGIVGTNIALSLERGGYEPCLWPIGPIQTAPKNIPYIKNAMNRTAMYNRASPSLRIFHQFDLAQHVGKGLHCGFPIFELDKFTPTEINHLQNQDLIFVASKWARDILIQNGISENNIKIVRFGVDREIFSKRDLITPKVTRFINIGKWEVRKGHDFLIKAFCKAFTQKDMVSLFMASYNPCISPDANKEWENLYKNSSMGRAGKVFCLTQRLADQQQLVELIHNSDCGVFPSRAEGWNLPLAEMLVMGKPCIATNYSAHTEFVTSENCLLIGVDKKESAYDGIWFHGQGNWAELGSKQEEQLIYHLRTIHQNAERLSEFATMSGLSNLTWENTVSEIVDYL